MRRRRDPEPEETPRRRASTRPARGSRLAFYVLVAAAVTIGVRATVATVIPVHGDGMAPTLLDGDVVLMTRGRWNVGLGDLVVYAPEATSLPQSPPMLPPDPSGTRAPRGPSDTSELRHTPFPNAAVVDKDQLDAAVGAQWADVQRRSGASERRVPARSLRIGRVLARPGDRVTFYAPESAMGIAVNGVPLRHKAGFAQRMVLPEAPSPGERHRDLQAASVRATAYESLGDRRYPILVSGDPEVLEQLDALLVSSPGRPHASPTSVVAPGYLVFSDNRPEGACCDSRAIGWIDPEALEGEVIARLSGVAE
ncbi:MAG: S24/S26 family peptidase, partial [Nannocystaceae bacterium]